MTVADTRPKVWSSSMEELQREEWPLMFAIESVPLRVWRSKDYLAVLYEQRADGNRRLTVNHLRKDRSGKWRDGITWDELQRIKDETLGPDVWCVEVYPAESALVNENNQRHLWVLDGPPATRFPERAVTTDGEIRSAISAVRYMINSGMVGNRLVIEKGMKEVRGRS